MPPRHLDYTDYLVNFELFYRNIRNLGILSNEDLDFVKTRTKEAALSSYRNYNNNVPQHLSKEEFLALQNVRKNKNIAIQKSDKGNSVVVVHKADYLDKMENRLNDRRKFGKTNLKNDGILNFTINQEKSVGNILKKFITSSSISEETRRSLKPIGTRPGIMYGLSKVHGDIIDNCPSFRPFLSASYTPTSKLAKFFIPILKSYLFILFKIYLQLIIKKIKKKHKKIRIIKSNYKIYINIYNKNLAYLKPMLIYVNFTKVKNKLLSKK